MTFTRKFILFVTISCAAIAIYAWHISGTSVPELLDQAKSAVASRSAHGQAPAEATVPATPKITSQEIQDKQTSGQQGAGENRNITSMDFEELQKTLSLIDPKQRNDLLDNEEKFRNFVKNEADSKSVFAAAHANKVDQNEKNLLIAQRGADNILREIYLRQLLAAKLPEDFPSAEQIKTYYEKNKDKFMLPERVPVWQIFLPAAADNSQKKTENLKKQAESIISDINKNRMDFATAALRFSGHQESKFNGGFMGIVKTGDLTPEIKKVLMSLPPDVLSSPISTEDGIHILKHGPLIAKQDLQLDDVREQIKTLLINQARNELRQAIFKQAATSYPVDIDDKRVDEWRLRLRTNSAPEKAND